jgi:hypothetical protein
MGGHRKVAWRWPRGIRPRPLWCCRVNPHCSLERGPLAPIWPTAALDAQLLYAAPCHLVCIISGDRHYRSTLPYLVGKHRRCECGAKTVTPGHGEDRLPRQQQAVRGPGDVSVRERQHEPPVRPLRVQLLHALWGVPAKRVRSPTKTFYFKRQLCSCAPSECSCSTPCGSFPPRRVRTPAKMYTLTYTLTVMCQCAAFDCNCSTPCRGRWVAPAKESRLPP